MIAFITKKHVTPAALFQNILLSQHWQCCIMCCLVIWNHYNATSSISLMSLTFPL